MNFDDKKKDTQYGYKSEKIELKAFFGLGKDL